MLVRKLIRINHNSFLPLFLLLPFLLPEILTTYNFIRFFIILWKIVSFVITIAILCSNKTLLDSKLTVLLLITLDLFLVTMIRGDVEFDTLVRKIIDIIQIPLIIYIFAKKNFATVIKIIYLITSVTAIVNILTQLWFPDGIYLGGGGGTTEMYICGMENRFIFTYMIMIASGCILVYLNELKLSTFSIMLWLSAFSLFFAWSVGAMVGIVIMVLFFYLGIAKKNIINYFTISVINLGLFFFVVVFRGQEVFSFLIEGIFDKSLTFSGRTQLWDVTYTLISKHLWLGNGFTRTVAFGLAHPHNEVLYILYNGGIVLLLLHIIFFFLCFRKQKPWKGKQLYIWFCGIYLTISIILLVDSWAVGPYFYAIFILLGSFNEIVEMKEHMQLQNMPSTQPLFNFSREV